MDSVVSSIKWWFEKNDQTNYRIYVSRYPRDAIGVIRGFMAETPADTTVRVYAVGGDGILFDCLNGVVGFDNAELAVMPYGMTNNFVRAFGKQMAPYFRSIYYQVSGTAIPTDIIRCGGNYTLNFCTIGMTSDAIMRARRINHALEQGGRVLNRLCYSVYRQMYYLGDFLAAFNKEVTQQRYEITVDDERISGNFMSINIANSPFYGGNRHPAINAVPNDGVLDILIGKSAGSLKTVSLTGPCARYRNFSSGFIGRQGKKITIRSDSPLLINLDDEVFLDTCFTAEVIPQAVKIISVLGCDYEKGNKIQ
jgi:diacylglycerol kinase family enzyme